jgi:TetR/AcrR family transcriptional repressor of nem operon
MARPREFDETEALSGAMNAFWTNGYDGTSIPHLLQATGLSRSSLYETFGDKAALFEAATDLYFRTHGQPRVDALRGATSARQGLRRFFDLQIASCLDPKSPNGCLLTNTCTSLASHEPKIEELLRKSNRMFRAELKALLLRGQQAGEIPQDRDIESLSHMLMAVSFGLNVAARVDPDRRSLQAMANAALKAIE